MARRFRGLAWQLFGVTFLCNILAIGVPLFTMAIYDWVIPSRSSETLYYLGFGVLFLIVIESLARLMRGRYLAYIGGRIDSIIGTAAFQRIIHLPVIMTERSSNGAQLARLRQFESIREFFTGPLAGVFFDLPFVVVFIAAIAWIAGPVAWIPLVLAAIFLMSATIIIPASKRAVAECGEARSIRQSLVVEAFSNLRSIKSCNGEQVWRERFRDLSARAADAGFRSSQISTIAQTMGQSLMLSAGVATLAYGTMRVMSAEMTVGALVASMALVWRALGPLQTGFLCLLRFEQVILGLRQLNLLMKLAPERDPDRILDPIRTFRGEVTFHQVSMRYSPQGEPALMGVGFRATPGQIVAITGPSGSGKSTILKLVAGLYKPQAGAVLIDGIDIRQLDCAELRNAIAFVPQSCHLFHGTLAQNLRLANPIASNDAVAEAARDAALLDDILALPEGFNTRLTDQLQRQLPSSFRQRLMLARAYIKRASVFLLDEPGRTLDSDSDTALMRKLEKLRESATVFIVTQRPSHLRLADQIIVLDRGQVTDGGSPDVILPKLGMG
jgi:ATP-binding cassette subfamily C protein/ATP-binding cassette subfamily C protein LapB